MIVINDMSADAYIYGIPNFEEVPRVVYTSYLDAKKAITEAVEKFGEFTPVAYGDAYPYENTTFEKEISQKEYALIGWVALEDDEDDEDSTSVRVPIGLLKIAIQDNQQGSS
jgi:hypothetical protein